MVCLLCVGVAPLRATQPSNSTGVVAIAATPRPTPDPETPEGRLYKVASGFWRKVAKARKNEPSYNRGRTIVEKFDTDAGPIYFTTSQITFGALSGVPLEEGFAWVRLGKSDSTENGAAVRDFLSSSRQSKLDSGFTLVEKKESPADYGKVITSLSKRGDEYFKTYLQTIRNQNPNAEDSVYLSYTYYIEMGLSSRRKEVERQQVKQKLGD